MQSLTPLKFLKAKVTDLFSLCVYFISDRFFFEKVRILIFQCRKYGIHLKISLDDEIKFADLCASTNN